MLVLNTQLQNTPIMSLQNGGQLGTTAQAIIDPRKLQIIAYHATGTRIQEPSVLHASDIREIGPLGIIVDSADNIMTLDEDLVRLQEVIDLHFEIIGLLVVDEQKQKLGKVIEYTLETEGFFIQKIHVSQSLFKNITSSNLIINRAQIVELTDNYIVVKSSTVEEPLKLTQALNPFRKNQQTALSSKVSSSTQLAED